MCNPHPHPPPSRQRFVVPMKEGFDCSPIKEEGNFESAPPSKGEGFRLLPFEEGGVYVLILRVKSQAKPIQ